MTGLAEMRFPDYFKLLVRYFSWKEAWNMCVLPRAAHRLGCKEDLSIRNLMRFQRQLVKEEIEKYRSVKIADTPQPADYRIWTMWWQGRDAMPEAIRQCHDSLLRNARGHEVILIDKHNYRDYVSLPEWVITKLDEKKIGLSHFSDLVRLHLLSRYGGLWVDSALFVLRPFVMTEPLFMPSFPESGAICQGRWWFGILGAPAGFKLVEFMKDSLLRYWSRYDAAIEYLMWDGFMRIAYEEFRDISDLIDGLPRFAPQLHDSRYSFMSPVDGTYFTELIRRNSCFSLTWRFPYDEDNGGCMTFYDALIEYSEAMQTNPSLDVQDFLSRNGIMIDDTLLKRLEGLSDEEFSAEFIAGFKQRSNIYV